MHAGQALSEFRHLAQQVSVSLRESTFLSCTPRAPTALQVTFQVPSDLQPYLEVLPKHGVVQGESPFAAQLKFTPSKPLLEPPLQDIYHTPTDGLFRMPVQVGVASQVSCMQQTQL